MDDEDGRVEQAGRDLKAFVERLAGKSLDPVLKTAKKVGLVWAKRERGVGVRADGGGGVFFVFFFFPSFVFPGGRGCQGRSEIEGLL